MLNFRKIELTDVDMVRDIYSDCKSRMTDDTACSIVMWRDYFETEIAEENGTFIFKTNYPETGTAFVMPVGDKKIGVEKIREYCKQKSIPCVFCAVNREDLMFLKENFQIAEEKETRQWFEYVYDAEKMMNFPGKKLSGERNHKNNFLKNHPNWQFEEINEKNISKAKEFFSLFSGSVQKDSELFEVEAKIVSEALSNFSAYKMDGGMITSDGVVFAMAFGEKAGDTMFIHIEKARREINGAYQMIASEFVKHFISPEIKFVNREDDGGDEGLRKSKMSYHPEFLIEKFVVKLK